MHKAPTFAGTRRGNVKQPYPQFLFGEIDSWTLTHDCCFWWKTLPIAPRPDLFSLSPRKKN